MVCRELGKDVLGPESLSRMLEMNSLERASSSELMLLEFQIPM